MGLATHLQVSSIYCAKTIVACSFVGLQNVVLKMDQRTGSVQFRVDLLAPNKIPLGIYCPID